MAVGFMMGQAGARTGSGVPHRAYRKGPAEWSSVRSSTRSLVIPTSFSRSGVADGPLIPGTRSVSPHDIVSCPRWPGTASHRADRRGVDWGGQVAHLSLRPFPAVVRETHGSWPGFIGVPSPSFAGSRSRIRVQVPARDQKGAPFEGGSSQNSFVRKARPRPVRPALSEPGGSFHPGHGARDRSGTAATQPSAHMIGVVAGAGTGVSRGWLSAAVGDGRCGPGPGSKRCGWAGGEGVPSEAGML